MHWKINPISKLISNLDERVTTLSSNLLNGRGIGDCNLATDTGYYITFNSTLNAPKNGHYTVRVYKYADGEIVQVAQAAFEDCVYIRHYTGGTWSSWKELASSRQSASPTTANGTLTNWSVVEKSGAVVSLTFKIKTSGAVSAWSEIVNIPADYRPSADHNFNVATLIGTETKMMQAQILTSGAVRCDTAIPANTDFGFTVTYIK